MSKTNNSVIFKQDFSSRFDILDWTKEFDSYQIAFKEPALVDIDFAELFIIKNKDDITIDPTWVIDEESLILVSSFKPLSDFFINFIWINFYYLDYLPFVFRHDSLTYVFEKSNYAFFVYFCFTYSMPFTKKGLFLFFSSFFSRNTLYFNNFKILNLVEGLNKKFNTLIFYKPLPLSYVKYVDFILKVDLVTFTYLRRFLNILEFLSIMSI